MLGAVCGLHVREERTVSFLGLPFFPSGEELVCGSQAMGEHRPLLI
jgi:hypothetical protein